MNGLFALAADVSEAHRQFLIACDCTCSGVRCGREAPFTKTVGTIGVASAPYNWSQVASAVGHLTQYRVCHSSRTWHMPVAQSMVPLESSPSASTLSAGFRSTGTEQLAVIWSPGCPWSKCTDHIS